MGKDTPKLETTLTLWEAYHRERAPRDREALIVHYLGLVEVEVALDAAGDQDS